MARGIGQRLQHHAGWADALIHTGNDGKAQPGGHQRQHGRGLARGLGDARHKTGFTAQRQNMFVQPAAQHGGVQHKGLIGQTAQRHGQRICRLPGGQGQHQLVAPQRLLTDGHGNAKRGRGPHKTNINLPGSQRRNLLARGHVLQIQLDLGVAGAEVAQHGRERVKQRHRGGEGNTQPSRQPMGCHAAQLTGLLMQLHNLPGLFLQQQARRRQRDRPARTFKQLRPHFLLQQAYLLAQRGLAHVKALGGAAEVQLIGHGQETSEAAQIHRTIFVSSPDANGIGRKDRDFSQSHQP